MMRLLKLYIFRKILKWFRLFITKISHLKGASEPKKCQTNLQIRTLLYPVIFQMTVLAHQWSYRHYLGTYGHLRFKIYRLMSSVGQWYVDGTTTVCRCDCNLIRSFNPLLRLFFDVESIFEGRRHLKWLYLALSSCQLRRYEIVSWNYELFT